MRKAIVCSLGYIMREKMYIEGGKDIEVGVCWLPVRPGEDAEGTSIKNQRYYQEEEPVIKITQRRPFFFSPVVETCCTPRKRTSVYAQF